MAIKKLVIIRGSYRPDGGAEKIITRILEGLKTHYAMDVSLITKKWDASKDAGFKVLLCKKRGWLRHRKFNYFKQDVKALLKQHHFDLVQSHERIPGCQIYRAGDGVHKEWLRIRKQKASWIQKILWDNSPYHKAILQAEEAMFYHPDLKKVICNAPQIKRDILRHYPDVSEEKLEVIYNGINLASFAYADVPQQQIQRQALGLDKDANYLLYVGSGFQRKGLETLLSALALSSPWKLIVVGKDKQQKHYQRLCERLGIEDRVQFAGMQKQVQNYYAACDLLVHPALYDPAPNVVLEAMAIGRAVLVSRNCGNHELVEKGKNGFVFEANNIEQLATLLNNNTDKERIQAMGKAARKTAESYPVSRMVESFVQVYQSVLGKD